MKDSVPPDKQTPDAEEPQGIVDDFLGFMIMGVANRISASATAFYQNRYRLTAAARRLLLAGERGGLNVTEMALAADLDKTAASRALKELEGYGLVTIHRTQTRGGAVRVEFAPEAHRLHEEMCRITEWRDREMFGVLDEAERDALKHLLTRVLATSQTIDMSRFHERPPEPPDAPWVQEPRRRDGG